MLDLTKLRENKRLENLQRLEKLQQGALEGQLAGIEAVTAGAVPAAVRSHGQTPLLQDNLARAVAANQPVSKLSEMVARQQGAFNPEDFTEVGDVGSVLGDVLGTPFGLFEDVQSGLGDILGTRSAHDREKARAIIGTFNALNPEAPVEPREFDTGNPVIDKMREWNRPESADLQMAVSRIRELQAEEARRIAALQSAATASETQAREVGERQDTGLKAAGAESGAIGESIDAAKTVNEAIGELVDQEKITAELRRIESGELTPAEAAESARGLLITLIDLGMINNEDTKPLVANLMNLIKGQSAPGSFEAVSDGGYLGFLENTEVEYQPDATPSPTGAKAYASVLESVGLDPTQRITVETLREIKAANPDRSDLGPAIDDYIDDNPEWFEDVEGGQ